MSDSGKQEEKPMGQHEIELDHDREHDEHDEHDEQQEPGTEMSANEEVC
jgi:polyadenylate-binding protein 2